MRGGSPQLIVGSQDNDAPDGATFDALNVFQLVPDFQHPERSTFTLKSQTADSAVRLHLPVWCPPAASAKPTQRPGLSATAGDRRPESVPRHPVLPAAADLEAAVPQLQLVRGPRHQPVGRGRPGVAGVRWYELRNPREPFIYQQGTYAPLDGVHRWMGSVAMDQQGNMAAGYSVVNGTNVFPGIRYAGRRGRRPARHAAAARGGAPSGKRRADNRQLPLGRLHVAQRRPQRRLHLLLHQRVLHGWLRRPRRLQAG